MFKKERLTNKCSTYSENNINNRKHHEQSNSYSTSFGPTLSIWKRIRMGANQKMKNTEQIWCTKFSMGTLEYEALATLQFLSVSNNCAAEVLMKAEEV